MDEFKRALCPACHQAVEFEHIGTQTWPESVAQSLGLSPQISLYTCPTCHTTLSEPELIPLPKPRGTQPLQAQQPSSGR